MQKHYLLSSKVSLHQFTDTALQLPSVCLVVNKIFNPSLAVMASDLRSRLVGRLNLINVKDYGLVDNQVFVPY
jgi:hypothetical protein